MQVSMSSWHYKAFRPMVWSVRGANLCKYVRVVALRLILLVIFSIAFIFLGYVGYGGYGEDPNMFCLVWMVLGTIVLTSFLCLYGVKAYRKLQGVDVSPDITPTFFALLKAWWRAKKEKMCPMLEFVE